MPAEKYALITDATVSRIFADTIKTWESHLPLTVLTFEAGEGSKNRNTWAELTDRLISAGFGRDGAILAFGGGVTGDLAGFVAATFMRGIPYVQIPTTLLAMIDSSVGGKTGIDTPAGKNLVGAFHQPELVITDVGALGQLPERQIQAGMAEALKHGAIRDAAYFDFLAGRSEEILRAEPAVMVEVVKRSVEIKAAIVAADQFEHGIRAALNFGHTIGHAIEAAGQYGIEHGPAVAIGMVIEALLGTKSGITDPTTPRRLWEVIEKFHLPTRIPPELSPETVLTHLARDKKNRGGEARFSPIACIGEAGDPATGAWTAPLTAEMVQKILDPHT